MVSFDVKSMFTNIPVSFTIKLIIDALYHNGKSSNSNTLFNGFNPTKKKQLLEWVTKSGTFLFYNKYFEQIDGVPFGGKASNLFADVIMNVIMLTKVWKSLFYNTDLLCFTDTLMIASAFSMIKNRLLSLRKF